jgi:hypothetical protein
MLPMGAAVTKVCGPELYSLQDAVRYAKDPLQPLPTVLRGLGISEGILKGGKPEGGRFDESRLSTLVRLFLRFSGWATAIERLALPRMKLPVRDTDAYVRHAAFDALIHLCDHGPPNAYSTFPPGC